MPHHRSLTTVFYKAPIKALLLKIEVLFLQYNTYLYLTRSNQSVGDHACKNHP